MLAPWKESYDKEDLDRELKSKDINLADKDPSSQNYGFSSSHVRIWELDHKEGWALKNWCFQIVVLEKTLESPLDSKDIKELTQQEINPEYSLEGPWFNSWVREIHWRRDRLPTPVLFGFPCGSAGKESACSAGDLSSIPELGRSPGEGKGYSLQYSGLENSMDFIVHGVAKSQTQLSNFQFTSHWKDWCWNWSSKTLATWCKEPTHWKRPWCWESLKGKWEKGDRRWDG